MVLVAHLRQVFARIDSCLDVGPRVIVVHFVLLQVFETFLSYMMVDNIRIQVGVFFSYFFYRLVFLAVLYG